MASGLRIYEVQLLCQPVFPLISFMISGLNSGGVDGEKFRLNSHPQLLSAPEEPELTLTA